MGFTKLDNKIIDSSIWDEPSDVLKVFIAFWTKSDSDGRVQATYNAMYRGANLCDDQRNPLPVSAFEAALKVLMSPDPTSSSKEQDGRRIVRLSETEWLITTYKKHRANTYSDNPESARKRRYRKNGTCRDMSQTVPGHSASVSASDLGEEGVEEGGDVAPSGGREATITQVLERLNEVTGREFNTKTQAHRKLVAARLKEGHTYEDFDTVIRFKNWEWKGKEQAQYLRPDTLFRPSKFDGYLQAARDSKQESRRPQMLRQDLSPVAAGLI